MNVKGIQCEIVFSATRYLRRKGVGVAGGRKSFLDTGGLIGGSWRRKMISERMGLSGYIVVILAWKSIVSCCMRRQGGETPLMHCFNPWALWPRYTHWSTIFCKETTGFKRVASFTDRAFVLKPKRWRKPYSKMGR